MNNDPTPITRRTTGDQVTAEIRRQIWTGEIRSGEHLNQEDIAAALGVSRIPVREALITLANEGAVRMTPHKGAHVEPLTEQMVHDHYDLFGHIDAFALERAILRSDPIARGALANSLDKTARANDASTVQNGVLAARAMLYELGGSPRLRAVARGLAGLIPGNFFAEIEGSIAEVQHHLPRVAGAIRVPDADEAVEHYKALMTRHGELVTTTLRGRGVLVALDDKMEALG